MRRMFAAVILALLLVTAAPTLTWLIAGSVLLDWWPRSLTSCSPLHPNWCPTSSAGVPSER